MKPVADVKYEDLRIGDIVISAIGNTGYIVDFPVDQRYKENDPDRYLVRIDWDNQQKSHSLQPHSWLTSVEHTGENKYDRG